MTPEGWRRCAILEAADIVGGFAFPHVQQGRSDGPFPFFKVSDMNRHGNELRLSVAQNTVDRSAVDELRARVYPAGTIVFPKVGAALLTNKRRVLGRDGLFDNNIMGLVPARTHGPFLFFFMQTIDFGTMVQPGAVPSVNGTMVGNIPLLLPPLPEQRKIAAILSSVDEAIEGTQAVIDQLQVVKKAMLADLLTRGIPGRHKKFKQTEIGEVPEKWDVAHVGDLFETRSGGTPSREVSEYWAGKIPWVKTGEVAYRVIAQTEESVSQAALDNSAAKLLPKGTLLMAMYGQGATRGRVALLSIDAACNQACLAFLPGLRMTTRFLFHIFSSKYDELRSLGHEGTQKNLNAALVREVFVPCPSIAEQAAIGDILDSMESRSESETAQLQALVALKSALMSVLFTGEVRVRVDEEVAA